MSTTYVALDDADIAAGKPTKEEIFARIKDNQECFNLDIEALKQTASIDMFNLKFSGDITQYSFAEISARVPTYRADLSGSIVQVKMVLLSPSTSGSLQIEIDKSVDQGINWVPMLVSPVEITTFSVGDVSGAVNFSTQSFNQDDLIRIRIVGTQVDQGEFHIAIFGEAA